jgi:hypothetical protein
LNKKPPKKGDKTLMGGGGGERNLHFSELPKMKHQKEGGKLFEKIKEREERKQKGEKRGG